MNSPNVDDIENKINIALQNARDNSSKSKTNRDLEPELATLDNSIYLESQDPEKENILVTPFNQNNEFTNEYTFAKVSNTQLNSSVAYYRAETNFNKSSLQDNLEDAEIQLTLMNANGTTVYQNTYSKNAQSVLNYSSNITSGTCVGDCIDDTYDDMNWGQFAYCLFFSFTCFFGVALGCIGGCAAILLFL